MLASVRAGFAAALVAFFTFTATAADKPFQRADLADSAVRLETQIKTESGQVAKPVATLRSEAEAAFARRDFRAGMQTLAQIVSVAPREAGNWLRLSRAILQIRANDDRERVNFLERAATAAYIAYQRSGNAGEEADALVLLGRTFAERKLWRPALDAYRFSLDLREVADVRQSYEQLRDEHGFRILDYSVDADAASPRACFQFSEDLPGKRTDFSPFVAVEGNDKPAISTEEKQLCVEGLRHGERYSITLRAGLPSTVKETLQKSADYNIYVRDRSPYVRFTGKAYVLPRTGQRGIPVVSVNTSSVQVKIHRIGDRNLIDTVLSSDFQKNIDKYDRRRLETEKGALAWQGEMKIDTVLNADVTTAFPIDQAIGDLKPGVYVMTAEPEGGARNEDYGQLATQWFIVSDLGLTAFSGNDGINVFLNSLATTEAKAGIEIRLIARNNEVLASRTTDAAGFTKFEAGLARGEGGLAPAMLVADGKGDYAFLSLKGPAFDLTDRGVAGRAVTAGLDAFVYAERGVYRTGETVHLTALLRDAQGAAVTGVPMTLVVDRPDGVEYRRTVVPDQGIGGRSLSFPMISAAPTGTYRVRAYTDPKGPAVGSASFLVEDYVPDRMEFDLASPTGKLSKETPAEITLDGRFLYGAPASNLDLEGEMKIKVADQRPGFAGYQFGINDDEDEIKGEQMTLEDLPQTDDNGKAKFTVTLDKMPSTSRPIEAAITVRLVESGGRAVERNLTLPIVPTTTMIGVKPLFSGKSLGEGESAGFDVIVAAPDGRPLAASGLRYELLKVERRYQYYRRDGRWEYEPVKSTQRVADGRVDAAADRPGRIALPVTWGRYRLDVASDDRSIPPTSVTFDAGFYSDASADTPDLLEIALDKPEYASGDTMTVAVTARTAGKVTLNVVGDKLLATVTADVQAGTARIPLTVGREWGSGAYVVATLRRPLDEAASRMPGRAIGLQWFSVDRRARTLAFDMPLPSLMRPNGPLRVPMKINGLSAGEEARIVVAAVDVGILNLTNYKPPAPDDFYLGQRRLTAEVRDLYGQLLDGMQGTRGTIRTGGDAASAALAASPPTQPPLALYSGIVTVKSDGWAEVLFDIPAFAGTVRVMAVAWSKDKVGKASGDVTVRDPVVLTATLPRFLLTGDRGTIRLDLDNVEGPAGDYAIRVQTDGPLQVGQAAQTVKLAGRQRSGVSLPVNATAVGIGSVAVKVSGPNGFEMQRSYALAAKPSTQILTRRTVRPIARNESISISGDLFADLVPGTGGVQLSVGPSTALDVAALLKALDRYPFGCSEQTTSRALPLLYVNELASESHLSLDIAIDDRIKGAIERLLARQGSNGSFGLWAPGGGDMWLDAYVTDFLTRARERNFAVPDVAFRLALDNLRNHVAQSDPAKNGGSDLAYVYYVLARNGVAPIGDLRYLADTRLDALKTPIGKAQLAAALGMLGDKTRAERVYNAALEDIAPQPKLEFGRTDYGSSLRDASAFVALASEGNAPRASILKAVERIEAARALSAYTSTQENAWMVLAARALARDTAGMALEVGGETRRGPLYRSFRASDLASGPMRVTNNGDSTVQAVVSVIGAPLTPEPAADKGFSIQRLYYTLDGEPAEIGKVKQNERFAVVLKITEGQPTFGRIIVADYLPAGFEIDNPRLVSSGDTGTLSWIEDAKDPTHSEFRDDRFTAAFDRASGDKAVFTVAYVVRAVSPGKYVLPQAYVEDMYRPDRFGRTGVGTVEIEAAK
ncbi:MAG: alpha-2-macroglobulin family protein [Alphaproteobacteria bacterium]|nr:MAG: alpha-2-macroglobulin family protein [Alphaproteobacteria bacterium]